MHNKCLTMLYPDLHRRHDLDDYDLWVWRLCLNERVILQIHDQWYDVSTTATDGSLQPQHGLANGQWAWTLQHGQQLTAGRRHDCILPWQRGAGYGSTCTSWGAFTSRTETIERVTSHRTVDSTYCIQPHRNPEYVNSCKNTFGGASKLFIQKI